MRGLKLVAALLCVVALTVPVEAQWTYVKNVRLTIGASAVGFDSAVDSSGATCTNFSCIKAQDGHVAATAASCVNLSTAGGFYYAVDGTTATANNGNEVSAGASVVITGGQQLLAFSAIRTGSTSGSVRCVLSGR